MPRVHHEDIQYILRWDEASYQILKKIASDYFVPCKAHKLSGKIVTGQIKWKKAEADGALRGLPYIPLKDISHRYSDLKRKYENPEEYREKKRGSNKNRPNKKKGAISRNNQLKIWKDIPEDIKEQLGYKPRKIWTEKQQEILKNLGKKYSSDIISHKDIQKDPRFDKFPYKSLSVKEITNLSKKDPNNKSLGHIKYLILAARSIIKSNTKTRINWVAFMKDPDIKKLPKKYHGNLWDTRKYFWTVCSGIRDTEEFKRKRREDALRYKKKNYKKYLESQKEFFKLRTKAVNKYLNIKLDKF